jgi:predicted nuclease of restriction endonuclease-like (RecB) superfamily
MATQKKAPVRTKGRDTLAGYDTVLAEVVDLLEAARRASVRTVNAIMTATYWEVGRRIVEHEQRGTERAGYGEALLERLSMDLSARFGKGFGRENLRLMRNFYLCYPPDQIPQTLSGKSALSDGADREPHDSQIPQTLSGGFALRRIPQTTPAKSESPSRKSDLRTIAGAFPLPWSHYVRLLSVRNPEARAFYEAEALRGGWSVRQLDRQIQSQFHERTLLSKDKAAMLTKGAKPRPGDALTPEEEIKDPYVLEFLGLKDEYSEAELEEALIRQLESFLLELGGDFAFVGRQRRLRVGDQWFRVDLLFFHRRLRCLVVIDLKLGVFAPADVGQMHFYLNYAREQWTHLDENPPVGLILCAAKDAAVAHYALDGLPNKVLAAEYRTALPDEEVLVAEVQKTRRMLEGRTPT